MIAGACLVSALLTSCSSVSSARWQEPVADRPSTPIRFSIVYVIHGDGGYEYHDEKGDEYQADEVALENARTVAESNPDAEVFIFHQKPRHRLLGLFWRLHDGEFYYYRSGRLVENDAYWRGWGTSRFDPEVTLYRRFRADDTTGTKRFFLYFGHEIPEADGTGYDSSNQSEEFTVGDLADGLKGMVADSGGFDLAVLSTCFNGTPHTVSSLAPYARYVIASPDNLHLSYLNTEPLESLESNLPDDDVSSFAKRLAEHSFRILSDELQTAVSVAVYDVDQVAAYVDSVRAPYEASLEVLEKEKPESVEHFDCADQPAYQRSGMSRGVDVFYRASRFGRAKNKTGHSGWECVKPAG